MRRLTFLWRWRDGAGGVRCAASNAATPKPAAATAAAGSSGGSGVHASGVFVRNNLTRQKELLSTTGGGGGGGHAAALKWYMCGPTVYDHTHIGHARTYVCFDIIHRLLTDYFNVSVFVAMGMTDVDDKIIARASERNRTVKDLASHFERDFSADMTALGVRPPAAILRVSDHIPDIIQFIQQIMKNGYAYADDATASDGGVWFDVAKFGASFQYGAMRPTAVSAAAAAAAAATDAASDENTAGASTGGSTKRNPLDFALWKRAKSGEPADAVWSSPWGNGRPGWHIECSAVSTAVFGRHFDIHSGGIDLLFPHHNNEIAQCQAHFLCSQPTEWCRTFLHTGHLHIAGHKMSKSLKNFITVKEFLSSYSAEQMRMFCLRSKYHSNIEYSADRMGDAAKTLKSFDEFFAVVKKCLSSPSDHKRWSARETELHDFFTQSQAQIRTALSDDFDTATAINILLKLTSRTHSYISACATSGTAGVVHEVLSSIGGYVSRMFAIFGFPPSAGLSIATDAVSASSIARPATAAGLHTGGGAASDADNDRLRRTIDAFVKFRQNVRETAIQHRTDAAAAPTLHLCDTARNITFPGLGVVLSDTKAHGSQWRELRAGEVVAATSDASASAPAAAVNPVSELVAAEEAAKREKLKRKEELSLILRSVSPAQMFVVENQLSPVPLYSAFDAGGVPTHDGAGNPLSATAIKKLRRKQKIKSGEPRAGPNAAGAGAATPTAK